MVFNFKSFFLIPLPFCDQFQIWKAYKKRTGKPTSQPDAALAEQPDKMIHSSDVGDSLRAGGN